MSLASTAPTWTVLDTLRQLQFVDLLQSGNVVELQALDWVVLDVSVSQRFPEDKGDCIVARGRQFLLYVQGQICGLLHIACKAHLCTDKNISIEKQYTSNHLL